MRKRADKVAGAGNPGGAIKAAAAYKNIRSPHHIGKGSIERLPKPISDTIGVSQLVYRVRAVENYVVVAMGLEQIISARWLLVDPLPILPD